MSSLAPEVLRVAWLPRSVPLAPLAVAARGAAARSLAERVCGWSEPERARFVGAVGPGCFVLLADGREPAELPWVEGVEYLGVEPEVRGLYLPTALAPSIPAALVVESLRGRGLELPLAVLVQRGRALVPLGKARSIDPARLRAWLERAS